MSQDSAVLQDLKRGRVITPMTALKRYGCFRLAARIHRLRSQGHNIQTTMTESNGRRFAQYRMPKP